MQTCGLGKTGNTFRIRTGLICQRFQSQFTFAPCFSRDSEGSISLQQQQKSNSLLPPVCFGQRGIGQSEAGKRQRLNSNRKTGNHLHNPCSQMTLLLLLQQLCGISLDLKAKDDDTGIKPALMQPNLASLAFAQPSPQAAR